MSQQIEEPVDVARHGRAIYEEKLKTALEPEQNGKAIAIHLDTGDWAVAEHWGAARRVLRQRRPAGLIASFMIGPAAPDEHALAHRIAAGQKP
jgi:hypothetical protein